VSVTDEQFAPDPAMSDSWMFQAQAVLWTVVMTMNPRNPNPDPAVITSVVDSCLHQATHIAAATTPDIGQAYLQALVWNFGHHLRISATAQFAQENADGTDPLEAGWDTRIIGTHSSHTDRDSSFETHAMGRLVIATCRGPLSEFVDASYEAGLAEVSMRNILASALCTISVALPSMPLLHHTPGT
jgi:hypothetical protein